MNKIHNVIWSKAQNAWVVVAEGSRACSKAGSGALKVMIALIMLSPAAGIAASLPQGGAISVGQGTITTNGSNQMVIKQTSDKLGINWQSFNVGADGHVVFDQPNSKSVALNRVIGSDGSSILGKIDANGQVFLINPNGVIFGKDAKVNVGGLVASTLNISDEDFKAGNYKLTAGSVSGEVVNNGSLQSAEGGYIALIGKSVKNNGLIKAQMGTAALAAGDAVTLDFSGDGLINIQVDKSAVKALVDNQGMIQADGGNVLMTARASNAALETVVNNDGIIQAQTISSKSGKIFLDGGPLDGAGTVVVNGTLDARAVEAGNGGFIETSGKEVVIKDTAKITTLASNGKTGTWLVDPTNFEISTGYSSQTSSRIGASNLSSLLESTNVEIETMASGSGVGYILVNGDVSWNANTTLTLNAHHSVNLLNSITLNGDSAGLVINNNTGGANPDAYTILRGGTNAINLNGANTTYTENGINYTVIRDVEDLKLISADTGGHFVLGNNIDATATSSWDGGKGYESVGTWNNAFTGAINGLGHSLTNLTINRSGQDDVGLVGYANGALLSNLKITGSVNGGNGVGMVAGTAINSSVHYVVASGNVNGIVDSVGGLVGESISTSIDQSSMTGNVKSSGGSSVGGIAGSITGGKIDSSTFSGSVEGMNKVGGLAGSVSGSNIKLSSASVVATGNNFVGGIAGKNLNSTSITETFAKGTVKGANDVGGLVGSGTDLIVDTAYFYGDVEGTGNDIGGLVGSSTDGAFSELYSRGTVNGADFVGGLIGKSYNNTYREVFSVSSVTGNQVVGGLLGLSERDGVSNAYASGDVSATIDKAGGLIGEASDSQIDKTYSTGRVTSAGSAGGLLGSYADYYNEFTESYWDKQKSNQASSAAGIGKTTKEMYSASTWANWSVDDISGTSSTWRQYVYNTAPLLRFMMPTMQVTQNLGMTSYNYVGVALGRPSGTSSTITNLQAKGSIWSGTYVTFDSPIFAMSSNGEGLKNAGTYTLDKMYTTQFGADIYQTNTNQFTITPVAINLGSYFSKDYDGTTDLSASGLLGVGNDRTDRNALSATWTSGSYDSKNAGSRNYNVEGFSLTGSSAGNYTFTSSYTGIAEIYQRQLNVEAGFANKVYDGTDKGAGYIISDDHILGDDIVVTPGMSLFQYKNAGENIAAMVEFSISGADADNYYFWDNYAVGQANITKADLNLSAISAGKTYDGTTSITASLNDGRILGDDLTVSSTSASFNDKNAGVSKGFVINGVTVSGADADNYTWSNSVAGTAEIKKANLVVTGTANDKTYDGTANAIVSLADTRIAGDNLSVSSSSATFSDKNAGLGKQVIVNGINISGADAGNYTWNTQALSVANINKANLIVSAVASDKSYDGLTAATTTLADNRILGDSLTVTSSSSAFSDKNAGNSKTVSVNGINLSGADAANYNFNTSAVSTADIKKASITLSAENSSKNEGEADGSLKWKIDSGSLYGSDGFIGGLSREAGESAGIYGILQGDLTAGSNYNISLVPGEFEIIAKAKPPVVDPIVPPVIQPPVVKPPVNEELENTKEIITTVAVAAKSAAKAAPESSVVDKSSSAAIMGDYRLLNLGMKLPDDLIADDSTRR